MTAATTASRNGEPAPSIRRRTGDAGLLDRRPDAVELGVRASEHGDASGADQAGIEMADEPSDGGGLVLLVSAVDDANGVTVGSPGSDGRRLTAGREDVRAGLDDLGRAAMVRRKSDDLDAGEAVADVDQEARIGPVEGEDRLCRITHEEQVVVVVTQQVDESVLDRVEVLRLVDE